MRRASLALLMLALAALARDAGAAEKRKVTLWSFAPNNVEEYQARKADIEAKFNIELDIQVVAQDAFVQKLQAVMLDGKGVPDAIEWLIENNRILNANPKKSFVLPLDEYLKSSKDFAKVVPGRIAWTTYGGHVYGLPHDVHPVVLIYNDTLWKAAGVDVAMLETWDDFFEASKKLTAEKSGGKPLHYALPYGNDGLANSMFMIWQQSGSQILDRSGAPTVSSPEFTAFVKKWLEWQKTDAFTMWDWGNFKALLANGTLASYTSPDWWVPQVNLASTGNDTGSTTALGDSKAEKAEVKYQFRVRPLPTYRKGGPAASSWGGSFMAIPRGTKDPALIYKIIEYMEYDQSALKTRWEKTSMLPPFASVWEDPMFKQPDPRFGGQKLGELMVATAKGLPKVNSGDIFWDVINDFAAQYTEIASGKISVEEGLAATQKKAEYRFQQLKRM
ncbi:MAG TPA: extracellular solute-binding protein [Anaeromyxobacter sp.]|nr:extracellular solute-binding protein [Anaeromyxobacter sp.]